MISLDRPDFANLPGALRALLDETDPPSIFNLPQWYRIVARHGLERATQQRLYADDGVNCALAVNIDKRTCRLLAAITPYSCDYSAFVRTGAQSALESLCSLVRDLAREQRDFRSADLRGLDPTHPSFTAIQEGFREAGFVSRSYLAWAVWHEDVRSIDFDAYLERRPSLLRNTWRRRLLGFERGTRAAWDIYGDSRYIEDFVLAYEAVYAKSWKQAEPFSGFMPALIHMAAGAGALRMGVLRAGSDPIAAQIWLVWKGRATIFKLAYDKDWTSHSPGTLLTMRMIQEILARDHISEINFGRGDDEYKKLWVSARRERWGIEAERPLSARGARLLTALTRDRVRARTRRSS